MSDGTATQQWDGNATPADSASTLNTPQATPAATSTDAAAVLQPAAGTGELATTQVPGNTADASASALTAVSDQVSAESAGGLASGAESGLQNSADLLAAVPDEGSATLAQQTLDRLVEFLTVGGPVVWILGVFSIVALTIVLVKIVQFALLRPESSKDVDQALALWRQGQHENALAALRTQRPVSSLVAIAMQGVQENVSLELLREELTRVANRLLQQLRAFLRPLELIATLSPLLGLLGTVLGMITAFQQMESAGSQVDPSVLSGGIWQALLTTAVGLAVAIPVVTLHAWLERKVERVAASMNDAVTRVFTAAPANKAPALVSAGVLRDAA